MTGVVHRPHRRHAGPPAALAVLACAGLLAFGAPRARATAFLAKDEALALAFPGADRIEDRILFVSDEQKTEIERLARAPLETKLWTVHVGWKGDAVQGYAIIDSHIVRTLPETFMVVLDPHGKVERVEVLAFHEPQEYLPPGRWMEQFNGRILDDDLKLRAGIQGITGATLSAQAMTSGVRRVLAIYSVLLAGGTPAPTPAP